MSLKSFFNLLYCKYYDLAKYCSNDELYGFTSVCFMALLIALNLYTIYATIEYFVFNMNQFAPPVLATIFVVISLIFILDRAYKKEDYTYEYKKFMMESSFHGVRGTFIAVLYVIITLALALSPILF